MFAPLFVTGCVLVDGATSPGLSTSNGNCCGIVVCQTKPDTFLQLPDDMLPEETRKRITSEAAQLLTLDQRQRIVLEHRWSRHILYTRREWPATGGSTSASSLQLAFVQEGLTPDVGLIAWHTGGGAHIGACHIKARKQSLHDFIPVDTAVLTPELASDVMQADSDVAHYLGYWQGPRQRASIREAFDAPSKSESSRDTPPSSPGKEHGRPRNAARPARGTTTSASSATDTASGGTIGGHTKHLSDHQHPLYVSAAAGTSPGDSDSSTETCDDECIAAYHSLGWEVVEEVEVDWELCETGEPPDEDGICWEDPVRDNVWAVDVEDTYESLGVSLFVSSRLKSCFTH